MSRQSMGGSAVQARPPERGVFPLDREQACSEAKTRILECLKANNNDHSA